MATAEISATAGTVEATAEVSNQVGGTTAALATLDTAVDTVVTDHATAFTAYDTFGAAVVAITGDTYSNTTHLFTFGGATGLNHAQWATEGALLNTAIGDFKTAKADALTAQTDSDAAVAAGAPTADMTVYLGSLANIASMDVLEQCWRRIKRVISGSHLLAAGSPSPRVP